MPNKFAKGVPCLSVKDCPAAILYYCDVLGFQKDFDDAVLGRDVTLFAGVSRDEFALTLNQHPPYVGPLIVGCDDNLVSLFTVQVMRDDRRALPDGLGIHVGPFARMRG